MRDFKEKVGDSGGGRISGLRIGGAVADPECATHTKALLKVASFS